MAAASEAPSSPNAITNLAWVVKARSGKEVRVLRVCIVLYCFAVLLCYCVVCDVVCVVRVVVCVSCTEPGNYFINGLKNYTVKYKSSIRLPTTKNKCVTPK